MKRRATDYFESENFSFELTSNGGSVDGWDVRVQVDYVIFTSFVSFAVFMQYIEIFLFPYSWIEHQLFYQFI